MKRVNKSGISLFAVFLNSYLPADIEHDKHTTKVKYNLAIAFCAEEEHW